MFLRLEKVISQHRDVPAYQLIKPFAIASGNTLAMGASCQLSANNDMVARSFGRGMSTQYLRGFGPALLQSRCCDKRGAEVAGSTSFRDKQTNPPNQPSPQVARRTKGQSEVMYNVARGSCVLIPTLS